jgi:hypothetical protein
LWLMHSAIGTDTRRILGLISAPTIASLAMFGAVSAARHGLTGLPTLITLLCLIVVGALAYLVVMSIIGRRTVERFFLMLRSARSVRAAGT